MSDASKIDLEARMSQLCSLLPAVHGVGADNFNQLDKSDRDNILWLASTLADEIKERVCNGETV